MSKKLNKWVPLATFAVVLALISGYALAADVTDIASMAENVTGAFQSIGKLMTAVAYICGFGFTIGAIFKFKAHKDNPAQNPIGTPLALLAIGISLIFLPAFIRPAGTTLVGSSTVNNSAGGFTGGGVTAMPGGQSGTPTPAPH